MKYWEIIAGHLSKAGWRWAASQRLIPAGERSGLQTRTAGYGKRFIVRADDILTAFLELESAIHQFAVGAMS